MSYKVLLHVKGICIESVHKNRFEAEQYIHSINNYLQYNPEIIEYEKEAE